MTSETTPIPAISKLMITQESVLRIVELIYDIRIPGVGSTDHFSALKNWMFENKFVSLLSHLKTIEPMEVHRESRTMCNSETSKMIRRTDPMILISILH